jgi:hypothetical protein
MILTNFNTKYDDNENNIYFHTIFQPKNYNKNKFKYKKKSINDINKKLIN